MIFVDTSFWVALQVPRDPHHDGAQRALSSVGPEQLVTSNHVRGETWTFLRRRTRHGLAVDFVERLERTRRLQIAFVSERLEQEALAWLRKHDERQYSFVDATSFALMRSLAIERALAFDGDFAAAGFVELRA